MNTHSKHVVFFYNQKEAKHNDQMIYEHSIQILAH